MKAKQPLEDKETSVTNKPASTEESTQRSRERHKLKLEKKKVSELNYVLVQQLYFPHSIVTTAYIHISFSSMMCL